MREFGFLSQHVLGNIKLMPNVADHFFRLRQPAVVHLHIGAERRRLHQAVAALQRLDLRFQRQPLRCAVSIAMTAAASAFFRFSKS